MGIKIYSVSLDEQVVERAKDIYKKDYYGKKLSPLIERLLIKWVKDSKKEVFNNGKDNS